MLREEAVKGGYEDIAKLARQGIRLQKALVIALIIFAAHSASYAGGQIFISLDAYGHRTKRGYAVPDNVGFIVNLANRRFRAQDIEVRGISAQADQGAAVVLNRL